MNYVQIMEQQEGRFDPAAHNRMLVQQELSQLAEQYAAAAGRVQQMAEQMIHTQQEGEQHVEQLNQLKELMSFTVEHPLLSEKESYTH